MSENLLRIRRREPAKIDFSHPITQNQGVFSQTLFISKHITLEERDALLCYETARVGTEPERAMAEYVKAEQAYIDSLTPEEEGE